MHKIDREKRDVASLNFADLRAHAAELRSREIRTQAANLKAWIKNSISF